MKLRRRGRHTEQPSPPKRPVFWDQVVGGKHVTFSVTVRAFAVATAVSAIAFAVILYWAVSKVQEINKLATETHQAQLALAQVQSDNHQQRIEDQQRTDQEISDLVCTVAAYVPPGQSVLIDHLRNEYHCAAYKNPPGSAVPKTPVTPPTHPTPMPSATHSSSTPTPSSAHSTGQAMGQPSGQNTSRKASSPAKPGTTAASKTPTPVVTAHTTSHSTPRPSPTPAATTPLINVGGTLCSLLGLCLGP